MVCRGTYFFTIVTKDRLNLFLDYANAKTLYNAIKRVQYRKPFEIVAYSILPDHWHILIRLPVDDNAFSQKIREIKRLTTSALRDSMGNPNLVVWQDRFWEHTVRDENDLTNCFNYIHYNPVHHQLVDLPEQWKWSSYCDYYGLNEKMPIIDPKNFEKENRIYGE